MDSIMDSCYGQHGAHWLGFYDYFNKVLKLEKLTENLGGLWMISKSANWFIPHKNICLISERHNKCTLNLNNKLHSNGSAAIEYPDGWKIWALNGVRVTQEIAETPADKLNPELVLTEKNAEIRREIVKKIDIVRVLKKLNAKTIHKKDDYELINLDLRDGRFRPYLKMLNPSIKVWHVEGVHPDCKTVEQALNWRNGCNENPIILT